MHIVTRFKQAPLYLQFIDIIWLLLRLGQGTNVSRPSYGRQFSYSSYNDSESSQGSSEGGAGEDDSDQFSQVSLLLIIYSLLRLFFFHDGAVSQSFVQLFWVQWNGLFILPDMDSDPNPGIDVCPKNGYSSDQGSRSGSEYESESVQ